MLEKARREYPSSSYNYTRTDEIPGFQSRMACFWDAYAVKWWMSTEIYLLLSIIGLTWFYRLAFNKSTAKTFFHVGKEVFYLNTNENGFYQDKLEALSENIIRLND